MHTFQEIKFNQKEHYDKIVKFLANEFKTTKKKIYLLKTNDQEILEKKDKLKKTIKKTKLDDYLKTFMINYVGYKKFFYAFWDESAEEVKIYKYDR